MELRISIGLLLACIVAVLPGITYSIKLSAADKKLITENTLYVYDDDKNLVQITLEDDDSETEEQVAKDLENRVFFFLYTLKNPTESQQLYIDNKDALQNSNFDAKKQTHFVTHGWMNSLKSETCTLIRDAYLKHGDYNVIVIDWSKISKKPYIYASRHVKMIANYVAVMINFLEKNKMDVSKTTLVGHSLGAHVVGLTARESRAKIKYIIGLDPALPTFYWARPGSRISDSDAKYVEIIHTNAGFLGYSTAIGDHDYYPNGGTKQAPCSGIPGIGGACSHSHSYIFYAESINSDRGFYSKRCDSYPRFLSGACDNTGESLMGAFAPNSGKSGTYYLMTRSKSPFAMGKDIKISEK